MTDRYEKIRKALEMGPTPGPWTVRYDYVVQATSFDGGRLVPVAQPYGVNCDGTDLFANARLIAACDPDTAQALLDERDALEAENERLRAEIEWLRADEEGHAITAVEVTLFGRACYLPADIAQEVERRLEAAERVAEASRQLVSMYERATGLPCPPQLRRALAAYDNKLESARVEAWQPIETCPSDERVVMFCDERNNIWTDVAYNKSTDYCTGFPPTYWRDLPAPPATQHKESDS